MSYATMMDKDENLTRRSTYEDVEYQLKDTAHQVVDEFIEAAEEEENLENNKTKLVSVFRLKLLEAQLHESLSDIVNDSTHKGFENDAKESSHFIGEIDDKIEEIKKWRLQQIEALQAELANLDEGFPDTSDIQASEEPETDIFDANNLDFTDIERNLTGWSNMKADALHAMVIDLQKTQDQNDLSDALLRSENQDYYHNSNVDLNRIEHEARISSSVQRLEIDKQILLSNMELERDMSTINHSLAATSFELDRILSKI